MEISAVLGNNPYAEFGTPREKAMATAFVNLRDNEISALAALKTREDSNSRKHKKAVGKMINSIPVVAGIATGVLTGGSLGRKLSHGAGSAAVLGLMFGLTDGFYALKNKITSKSSKLQNFEEKNPVLSTMVTLGAGLGLLTGTYKGFSKLTSTKGFTNAYKAFNKFVNNSKLAKQWLPAAGKKIAQTAAKAPAIVKSAFPVLKTAAKTVLRYSPVIMIGAAFANSMAYNKKMNKNYEKNYEQMKSAQLDTARTLTAAYSVENDLLKINS